MRRADGIPKLLPMNCELLARKRKSNLRQRAIPRASVITTSSWPTKYTASLPEHNAESGYCQSYLRRGFVLFAIERHHRAKRGASGLLGSERFHRIDCR